MLSVCGLTKCVNGADVRMIERRSGARLLLEATHTGGVRGQCSRQELDRDLSREAKIGGKPNFTHPASSKRADELVGVEARARADRHDEGL